jgi:isoamylase
MLATVLLSQGTPMVLGGDEFGRTQNGNNNAYCQDNEISWFNWEQAESAEGKALTAFVGRVAALRHRYPVLRCGQYLHGRDEPAPGVLDIQWFDQQGGTITSDAWNNPQERTLVLQRAAKMEDGSVSVLTCFFNPTPDNQLFKLPPPHLHLPTRLLLDSATPEGPERAIDGATLEVKARSVVLIRSVQKT